MPPNLPEVVLLGAPLLLLMRPGAIALKKRRRVGIDAHMTRRFDSMQLVNALVYQYEGLRYHETEKNVNDAMLGSEST